MSSLEMGMCLSFVVIAECAGVFNWGSHKIGSLDCLGGVVFRWILGCRVFLVNCVVLVLLYSEVTPLQSFKKRGRPQIFPDRDQNFPDRDKLACYRVEKPIMFPIGKVLCLCWSRGLNMGLDTSSYQILVCAEKK
jgi:hypothetical protein